MSPNHFKMQEELEAAILRQDMARLQQLVQNDPQRVCLRDENGRTPLHFAAIEANGDAARLLLNSGADVDARDRWGRTPLFIAIYEEPLVLDRKPIVQLLLESGADINSRDCAGDTPLHMAALGETALVGLLLEHGADASAVNDAGDTPLQKASQYSEPAVMNRLLQHGRVQPGELLNSAA